MVRLFVIFTILLLILAPIVAFADESPACSAEGEAVVCTRAGFDTLVGKFIDVRAAGEKCVLEAQSRTADLKVLETRVALAVQERDLARAELALEKARPFPRRRMLGAVALGAGAGVAAVGAAQVDSTAFSVSLLGAAVVSATAAVVLVALE